MVAKRNQNDAMEPCSQRPRDSCRAGMTLVEVAVAAAILAAVLATSVKMIHSFGNQQRGATQRVIALLTVQNTMEQLTNRPWGELPPGELNGLTIPEPVASVLSDAKVTATIVDEGDEISAKRISIALSWKDPIGRDARPARLVSWVFPEPDAAAP